MNLFTEERTDSILKDIENKHYRVQYLSPRYSYDTAYVIDIGNIRFCLVNGIGVMGINVNKIFIYKSRTIYGWMTRFGLNCTSSSDLILSKELRVKLIQIAKDRKNNLSVYEDTKIKNKIERMLNND